MTETVTEALNQTTIEGDKQSAAIVLSDGTEVFDRDSEPTQADLDLLSKLALPIPIALPRELRRAFAMRQRIYASVLDPSDYLYTVSYKEAAGRTRQEVFSTREEAQAFANQFPEGQTPRVQAKPKKSGIVKLARALGVTAKVIDNKGLPKDPSASHACFTYEAEHQATGIKEIGIGWCDRGERSGKISIHDVIATADTRAYNRAILRVTGFGDVSADEVVDDDDYQGIPTAETGRSTATLRKPKERPPINDDSVVAASRAWAEAIAARVDKGEQPFVVDGQQNRQIARELRAKARRGSAKAGDTLGNGGFTWEGEAQDGLHFEGFQNEPAPVNPDDVHAVRRAAQDAPASTDAAKSTSKSTATNASGIPQPDLATETITNSQARSMSAALMEKMQEKAAASAWVQANCHVKKSVEVRMNQFESIMKAIGTLPTAEPKQEAQGA